jgi:hypothetical protein
MNTFRKILRIVFLTILIILACSGAGMMLPLNRYRFMDNETRIELVESRNEEEEDTEDSEART